MMTAVEYVDEYVDGHTHRNKQCPHANTVTPRQAAMASRVAYSFKHSSTQIGVVFVGSCSILAGGAHGWMHQYIGAIVMM